MNRIHQQQRGGRSDGEGDELRGKVIDQWSPYFLTWVSGYEPWVFLSNPN